MPLGLRLRGDVPPGPEADAATKGGGTRRHGLPEVVRALESIFRAAGE